MTGTFGPDRWANTITQLLNQVLGSERFPIDVVDLIRQYSAQRFPGDAVTLVQGADLPGFDGALYPAPSGKSGWGIIYNNAITSVGRKNFTLAHEFGHYLLHRQIRPKGIRCGEQDVVRWDSEYGQIEHQANKFAAGLLMPLDDFRRQIEAKAKIDFDMISHCADRYRVSLIAAILRWLDFTEKRAVLVVSCDGFIKWARSSPAALKTRAFFRTSQGVVEIPAASPARGKIALIDERSGIRHGPGVWFPEEVLEMTIYAEQYDFFISLLLLEDQDRFMQLDAETEPDAFEHFSALQASDDRR
nr:F41 [uncultured bacterium]